MSVPSAAEQALNLLASAEKDLEQAEIRRFGGLSREEHLALARADRYVAAAQVHAVLAVGEELVDLRLEVAEVAAAVRTLAVAIERPRRRWFSRRTEGAR